MKSYWYKKGYEYGKQEPKDSDFSVYINDQSTIAYITGELLEKLTESGQEEEYIEGWVEARGHKQLVEVIDVSTDLRKFYPNEPVYLRVYFWGGYYNVNDDAVGTPEEEYCKAEWPDRWGEYVGPNRSLPEKALYGVPTEQEMKEYYDKIV